jgi:hypothetical protein
MQFSQMKLRQVPLTRRYAPPSPARGEGINRVCRESALSPPRERAECVSIPGEGEASFRKSLLYLSRQPLIRRKHNIGDHAGAGV